MQTIREQNRLQKMLQKKLSICPQDVRATYCDENGEILFINYGLSFYIGKKKGLRFFLHVMENNYMQDDTDCYNWFVETMNNEEKRFEFSRGWVSDPMSQHCYSIMKGPFGYQDSNTMDISIKIYNKPRII